MDCQELCRVTCDILQMIVIKLDLFLTPQLRIVLNTYFHISEHCCLQHSLLFFLASNWQFTRDYQSRGWTRITRADQLLGG